MNLRPTPACRAMLAMPGCRPASSWAAAAARTSARLCSLSSRRACRRGSAGSVRIVASPVALDAGEQPRRWLGDDAPEPDRYRGVELRAGAPEHGDGLLGGGPLVARELFDEFLAAVDDPPERGDLLRRGDRGLACPVLEFGHRGAEPLLAGEQADQVGPQLGQVARVAAEVGAPEALVAEWACLPVRLDVDRLGADAEGHGDLSDCLAGRLCVEEPLDQRAAACAAAVHLERGEQIDGLALALGRDPVIRLRAGQARVAHQLCQYLDGRAGVRMALGKAVPERVDDDIGAVVGLTPWAMELGQAVYPGTEVRLERRDVAGPCAPRVHHDAGKQGEGRGGGAGIARGDPCLPGPDDLGRLVIDGQPIAAHAHLGHVVDEHRRGTELAGFAEDLLEGQALETKTA